MASSISLLHKTPFLLLPHSLHLSFRPNPNPNPNPNPRLSHFPSLSSKKVRKIRLDRSSSDDNQEPGPSFSSFTDNWGETSDPATQSPADDEWGKERPEEVPLITDEWGEKTELVAEEAGEADAAADEDEWGNGSPAAAEEKEVVEEEEEDRVGDLKRCLVDTFYGTELGFRASAEVRGEIFELVSQLEARNPTPEPNAAPGILDGNWVLL